VQKNQIEEVNGASAKTDQPVFESDLLGYNTARSSSYRNHWSIFRNKRCTVFLFKHRCEC